MNRFLKLSATLFLSFNLSILFLIGLSELKAYSKYFYDKSKGDLLKYEDIEIAIFGNSQTLGGINQFLLSSLTNKNSQNFSRPGIPLFYIAKRINHFLKKNSKSKIIVELGTNQIDEKGMIRNLIDSKNEDNSFIRFLSNNSILLSFEEKLFFFRLSPKKAIVAYVKSLFNPFNVYRGIEYNAPLFNELQKIYLKKQINKEWDFSGIDKNFELDELIKVISNNPNTEFLIVRIPEHKLNIEFYDNRERFEQVTEELKKFNNVIFKDYGLLVMENDFYRDFNHLSKKGMNFFTQYLYENNKDYFK